MEFVIVVLSEILFLYRPDIVNAVQVVVIGYELKGHFIAVPAAVADLLLEIF